MKIIARNILMVLMISTIILVLGISCKKEDNPIKFQQGTFPDTVMNLHDLNSVYDDYNLDISLINEDYLLIFSSNRKSNGGQFDLVQGKMTISFDRTTGVFIYKSDMTSDAFRTQLLQKANTGRDDFGPLTLYSSFDGFEYMILTSRNIAGNLDLFYLKNRPQFSDLPEILGPYPVKLLNSGSDEGYLSFNHAQDTAYFSSNRSGNFDILLNKKPSDITIDMWFSQNFATSVPVDKVNTPYDDKCPYVINNIMVFTSNRPEGYGGYDLYYSVFRNGAWSEPVNFGPAVNSPSDEYRPLIGINSEFTNKFLMFSSNRPGGKGRFDLYFVGYEFPK